MSVCLSSHPWGRLSMRWLSDLGWTLEEAIRLTSKSFTKPALLATLSPSYKNREEIIISWPAGTDRDANTLNDLKQWSLL